MSNRLTGQTLDTLARMHNVNGTYGFSIFRLQSDDTEIHIIDDYTISSALHRVPSLRKCVVVRAVDDYGTIRLLVRS